ncbi:serine hydrolase FSH [Coprinopsis sp. MPI-PUGE-AT-0042]|nr:serine hydrolase FSH [Coprinopsis sp. MPI-PUGE-AT-0042]
MKTVLVLHGYSQNASIFSKRIGALRKEAAKGVEFVFIDAPMVLQPHDLVFNTNRLEERGLKAEVEANEATIAASDDPSLTPRAWWKGNADRTKALGLEESIMKVREVLMTRKFDGVLGFSQGASFAAIISALLEKPEIYPPFLVGGKAPHPPFEFCVAVSGFKFKDDPLMDKLWTGGYSTPTLHVIGKTDVVVVEERSRALLEVSNQQRVEEHSGGHFVPSKGPWRKFLAAYMSNPSGEHPSPSAGGVLPEAVSGSSSAVQSSANSRSETPTDSQTVKL